MKTNRIYSFLGILFALMVFSGTVWADVFTHEFTSTEAAGSKTWSSVSWTLSMSGGQTDTYSSTQGAKYGTNKNTCTSVGFSTSGLSGTISSVTIEASRGSQLGGTLAVSVGSNAYTLSSGNTALTTSNAANVFTGNKTGALNISWTKSSGKGAFYIKKIVVKYGYKITFNCNGASSGCPSNISDTTKLPNPLPSAPTKSGYTFGGWYTNEGCTTAASAGASITANTTLYAKWTADASCDADPTIGAASLNGSFNSGGVTSLENTVSFSTTSCDPKTNCEWQDYGFVWGTSASPTVSNTKMQKGTSGDATSWDMTSPSTFTVDNTYKVRAYGKNGKTGAAFVYSASDLTFTPRSVTFNSNGGSAVSTKYIKSGGTITNPGAPATPKTGYTFDSWRTDADLGTEVNFSNAVNASTTYYAKWNAKTYAITLNANTGAGSSPASVNATYNAHALSSAITNPTKTDYIFEGWNTKADGSGLTVIGTDGELISGVSGYTDASGNWTKDGTETLYAKWTEHTYTNYRTKCCTDLGAIDGEVTLTQGGNSVTISGWSDVANVGTYTVKLYKKNGASWDLVSGSTSSGSAGTQGTRTGITSGSKSVTYTGLVVESEYKFTVQAIAGSAAYCDGVETAVTEINDVDVSSTPFKFRYSIYIDNGSNSGWAHHYIEPTGNTDEGSVDITLSGPVDNYQFKIGGGFSGWWGQTGESKYTTGGTQWTLDGSQNVKMQTWIGGTYTFTVDYSGTTNPKVTITYPSANQDAGNIVYWDASVVANWDHLHFRVGTDGNANAGSDCKTDLQKVPGTDNFYKVTTASFTGMRVWAIANNTGWTGSNTNGVYKTNTEDDYAVTLSSDYQDYVVEEDGVTLVPYGSGAMGSYSHDNNCRFYTVTKTDGMLTHNVSLNSPAHGTLLVTYTNTSGTTGQTVTEGNNADLAHRCILTITATPDDGYTCTSLTVNSSNFTSGNTHILSADAVVEATFTAQTCTVTLDNNSATSGSQQTVLATYDASMPLITTADGTPAVVAVSRTGYNFNGWWDNTSGGKQYYSYTSSTIASANNWDKTGSQTLYAQWIAKEYTIELDRKGASTGAESVTATYDAGTLAGWSAPSKTGYTFGGYWSGDNGTGTLVISTAGVLQNSVTISAVNWTDASGHWIKDGGVTLYAKWTADEYTISYKDEGNVAYSGSNSALLPTTHTYGAATDLVDGVKSGYRFDGWFDNSTCTGSAITSIGATDITTDKTYYAKWTKVHTVTWKVNGSTYETGVVSGNSQVANGEKISAMATAPANNTLSCSSKFMGWSVTHIPAGIPVNGSSNISALGLFTTVGNSPTITKDTVFYAVFAKQTNSDGYKYIGDAGTLADGEKYIFVDSKTAGSGHALKASDLAENSSAGKKGSAVSVSITSNAEGILITKENSALEFEYVSTGTKLKYADGLTTKYLFINVNGVGYKTGDSRSAYGTHQLYGWTNGYANRYVYYDGTNENFTISEDAQNMYAYIKQTPVYGDYRVQCDPNIVTVTYDGNSGSTTCENEEHDKRNDYTVCSTPPTRDYYTFAGWLCSADDKVYAANATISAAAIDADFTLTAQWTPVPYTITYNYNGGSAQVDPVPATSYTVESSAITLQTPTKGHDRFDGWYENADLSTGGVKTTIAAGSHENKTYYAKWTARHEIVFDADEATTTIYRADDEALNASVAGQGSIPANPSAPSACSSKEFVGWVAEEIDGETDDEPTFLDVTSKVNADKHYYAVWATSVGNSIAAVEDESFTGGEYTTYFGKPYGLRSNDKYVYNNSIWTSSDMTAGTKVKIKVKHLSNSSAATLTIALINSSGTVVTSTTLSTTANSNNIDNAAYSSNVELIATTAVTGYQITLSNIGSSSGVVILAATREVVATRSAYSTSCCATKVTLSENSPEHGTIVFGKTSVGTCGGDKEVSLTITPAAGYQLSSYAVATGDGKVAAKSMCAEVVTNNNSSAAQNITLTFAEDANGAYDVTAAFSEMCATAWTWTTHDGGEEVTTEPLEVYVGQQIRIDVTYSPAGLLSSHTNNTAYNYSPYPWSNSNLGSPSRAGAYFTVTGTNAGSTSVVLNHNDGLTKTIYYTVKALPLVHFTDNVHNVVFADVAGTLEANALVKDKTTPTTSDFSGTTYNTCEEQHEHLVGWIESSWADEHPNATHSEIAGAGPGVFYTAGADIDVEAQNGKTFYAVWSKIE